MSRPSSSASSHRPPTSTSSRAPPPIHTQTQTTVTVPFTPRPKHQSRDKLQGDHEFAQIVQNLASVRKIPKEVVRAELEAGGTGLDLVDGEDEVDPDVSYNREEATFKSRPLGSRVNSGVGIRKPVPPKEPKAQDLAEGRQSRNVSSTSTITSEKIQRERERPRESREVITHEGVRTTGSTTTTVVVGAEGKESRRHASSSSATSATFPLARANGTGTGANTSAAGREKEKEDGTVPSTAGVRNVGPSSSRPTSRAERHLPAASSSTADKGKQRADATDRYSSVHARAQGHGQHPRTGSTEIDDQDEVASGSAPPLTGHGRYGRNINGHGARPGSGLGSGVVVAIEERKLDGVPLVVQEAWVCEDLRFVLQVSLVSAVACTCLLQGLEVPELFY
jgi:hypothetical protein